MKEDYLEVEEGIREIVKALNNNGLKTLMSCEGHNYKSGGLNGGGPWVTFSKSVKQCIDSKAIIHNLVLESSNYDSPTFRLGHIYGFGLSISYRNYPFFSISKDKYILREQMILSISGNLKEAEAFILKYFKERS